MTQLPTTDKDTGIQLYWMKCVPENLNFVSKIPFEPHLINSFYNFKMKFNSNFRWNLNFLLYTKKNAAHSRLGLAIFDTSPTRS
jgi:hypothetical protein